MCQITEWKQLWLEAEGPSASLPVGTGLWTTTYKMWGAQLMFLICMRMCTFLKKWTSARDKFRALAFMNLLKSVMYVKHIIYNMVKLSTFWWCLKAKVSLLKMLLELKFEDKGIFSMQRFTAENLFLTKAMQVYYISRYFLCSLIVSKYKKKNISKRYKTCSLNFWLANRYLLGFGSTQLPCFLSLLLIQFVFFSTNPATSITLP